MVTKPIDWSIYTPGGTGVGQTQTPGQRTNLSDYQSLYANSGTVGVRTEPFAMTGSPSVSPYDVFDAAGVSGLPTANDQVVNTNRTFQTVRQEAEAGYLARATEQRDLARQGIQRTGADQYSQARMAMEQQRALSDTRGLTAGAREGAQQTLSATQQVALNQIESQTQSELLQLQQQGIQDEFLAQEWADRKVQQFQTESDEAGYLVSLNNDYNDAVARQDTEAMKTIRKEQRRVELQLYGKYLTPEEIKVFTDTGSSEAKVDEATTKMIQRVTADAGFRDTAIAVGLIVAGAAIIFAAGAVTVASVGTAAPITIPAKFGGKALLAVGIASLTTGGVVGATEIGQATRSTDREVTRVTRRLNRSYDRLIEEGFTPEEARFAVNVELQKLPPVFAQSYNRNYGG